MPRQAQPQAAAQSKLSFGRFKPWIIFSLLGILAARSIYWLWYDVWVRSELPGVDEPLKYRIQWISCHILDSMLRKSFFMCPLTAVKAFRFLSWLLLAMPSVRNDAYNIKVSTINVTGLPGRLYQPHGDDDGSCVIFIHGGGFYSGDTDSYDNFNYLLSHATKKKIISLDYPLSPEHQYPVALDRLTAGVNAIFANDSSEPFSCDAARSALFGDSAGGNLVIVLADRLETTGQPKPCLISLLYPLLQMEDFTTCSYQRYYEHALLGIIDRRQHQEMLFYYTGNKPQPDEYVSDGPCSHEVRTKPNKVINTELSPFFLSDTRLSLLPKVLLFTVENDMFYDESTQFFKRIEELKGENAKRVHFSQGFHGQATMLSGVFKYRYSFKMLEVMASNINSMLDTCSSTEANVV